MKLNHTLTKIFAGLLILPILATAFAMTPIKAQSKIYDLKVYEYNDRASLNWYTDGQYVGAITYGQTESYGSTIIKSGTADWHSFELTSLQPGTTYFYKALAKNKADEIVAEYASQLTTLGTKPASQVYKNFIYLNFNNNLYSHNNQYPYEVLNPNSLKFVEPSIWKGALQITDKNSHVIYKADPIFNSGYGTVMVWVRLEKFDKDMTIFETSNGAYALYYDSLTADSGKIVARAGKDGLASYTFKNTGTGKNTWLPGEWHQITVIWNGKMGGVVKLNIDGEKRAEAHYTKGGGAATFMVGNNYAHTQNFSNGQIDDFKLFDWDMDSTAVRNEYKWLALNQRKDLIKKPAVAGAKVRNFEIGAFIKTIDRDEIYLVGRNMEKIHIANMSAFRRLGNPEVITATVEELTQFKDGGKFYDWSRLPDGLFVKNGGNDVYLIWNGQKKFVPNEATFLKYGNQWHEIITISQAELDEYADGPMYQ